ncbi:MAG: hypothetical protein K1X88_02495 [Nannocystaceae bacterium]|nr:hypothetical protein [Nannocystaceae bacterium]
MTDSAITSLEQLPLPQRDVLELLALQHERVAPDPDYAGFGWARVDRIVLAAPDRPAITVGPAIVVALHSADEQPDPDDIELLFELAHTSVLVPMSRWLPELLRRVPPGLPLVLALCNPGRVQLRAPAGAPPLHVALGDVTSWLDPRDDGGADLRLSARRWTLARPAP